MIGERLDVLQNVNSWTHLKSQNMLVPTAPWSAC